MTAQLHPLTIQEQPVRVQDQPTTVQEQPSWTQPPWTPQTRWTTVCRYDDLMPERGVAALVDGVAVAVFRTYEGTLYALSNMDPFSRASVLSRGIVGDRGGRATVASPIYKQVFELASGVCLDDPKVSVLTYAVRVVDGAVEVGSS